MNFKEKALKIKAIILDVDGVLTDGSIGYSNTSNELKFFNAKDGLAISLALKAGYKVGILSGRESKANKIRWEELNISFYYEGIKNKDEGFANLLKEQGLKSHECMYMGDDLNDIQVLKKAGLAVIPNDAAEELSEFCDFKTSANGGKGAVRESIVRLLKESGKWNILIQKYT